jgi:C1A family cysteine protease
MRAALVCLLCLTALVAVSAIPTISREMNAAQHDSVEEEIHKTFMDWKAKFSRAYEGAEHSERFEVFKKNLEFIHAHNAMFHAGKETFHMALNAFADMTQEQWSKTVLGYKPELQPSRLQGAGLGYGKKCTHRDVTTVPDSIDWRTKHAVTPVKNQGQCGSCWSFSTTGAVEGAWAVSGHPLASLSEEELVQCDTKKDQGCGGGLMDNAYAWIIANGGITSEETYPYISGNGTTGKCNQVHLRSKIATISDWCDLEVDEDDLEKALVQQPVSVAIEADQQSFQFYSGGVLPASKCGTKLDHGVLAVGYGTDAKTGKKYWLVKNSWGGSWGDSGYIKLEREPKPTRMHKHPHSACGITKAASYPVV